MIYRILPFLLASCLVFVSCENKLAKERETLFNEVMEIHDEVMPKISDIKRGKKKLQEMIISSSEALDTVNQLKYEKALYQLNQADEAMFGWMNQFGKVNPSESVPDKEAIEILKEQKVSVTKMRDLMLKNIEEAGEVVEF